MTESGQRYYEDAKRIIALAEEADDAVQGINAEPRGLLTVTASVLFGRLHVMPAVLEFQRLYPAVEVNALFVDRLVNLLEEGVDLAVRIAELPDSTYRALRVGSVRRVLCAAPDYLRAQGIPQTPDDLARHRIILSQGLNPNNEIRFQGPAKARTIKLQPILSVSDNESAANAAMAGLGITCLLSYQIAEPLRTGKLKTILSEFEDPPTPIHIVDREGRYSSSKVRAFIDLIARRLREEVSLDYVPD